MITSWQLSLWVNLLAMYFLVLIFSYGIRCISYWASASYAVSSSSWSTWSVYSWRVTYLGALTVKVRIASYFIFPWTLYLNIFLFLWQICCSTWATNALKQKEKQTFIFAHSSQDWAINQRERNGKELASPSVPGLCLAASSCSEIVKSKRN